ncbi:MAG: response regulator [Treponema sp.]|nr:response regulator [Treponema sp.]
MKNPFVMHFENDEERHRFELECAKIDSKRVYFYAGLIFLFQIFLLIYDYVNPGQEFAQVQWIYRIMNSSMAGVSLLIIIATALFKKNFEKYFKRFYVFLCIYSVIILSDSILDGIVGAYANGNEDLTFFFICLMLTSCVFYINSTIVLIMSLIEYTLFNIVTYKIFPNGSHIYMPYPLFIIFITTTVSYFRAYQMRRLLRQKKTIEDMKKQAEFENEMKSVFLANMSHEIRTPMHSIIGMSELAMDFNLPDAERNTIRQIHSSGVNLLGIINDILDLSKIRSGKMEITKVDYDLLKLFYDIANVVLVRLKNKPVELRLEMDPELSEKFNGDDQHIRQIILNLAGNAAKFTEKGHISLRLEKLEKFENRPGYRASVIDTGVGIRQEDIGKLFGAFKQLDMSMNRTKGGTGLGLNISKNLVELMGGSIGLESEYGKGSCFYVNIPQEVVGQSTCSQAYKTIFDAAPDLEEKTELKLLSVEGLLNKPEYSALFAEEAERVKFLASKAKILVVDDNEVNLQIAQGLLKKLGVNAELAESGFKALDLIAQEDYDIIFMDHQMPVMDGVETLNKIRAQEKKSDGGQTPRVVIALSANVAYGSRESFLAAGFNDFLGKPVQGKDFQRILQKWLPDHLIEELEKNADEGSVPPAIPADFKDQAQKLQSCDIDVEEAIENAGGFENWFKVTQTFTRLISKNASDIENYLNKGDYKNYTILVHALKSSARIIGANKLSKNAEELEMLGKEIQAKISDFEELLGQIQSKTEKMLVKYREFEGILAPVFEGSSSSSELKNTMDLEEFEKIKADILQACDSCDLDFIEKEMEKLKGSLLPQEHKLDLGALADAVDQIDFEKIKELFS